MKIKKPCWEDLLCYIDYEATEKNLDMWFEENVEPVNKVLSEGVEVRGPFTTFKSWEVPFTHLGSELKALLINIQPIKQQSREEKLEELVKEFTDLWDEKATGSGALFTDVYDKAKALLESKE